MPVIQEPQSPPAQSSPDQKHANPDASKSTTFTGTVVKDGEQYVLRDSSGSVYKLDDSSRAQAFEGKTVKVTGRLDSAIEDDSRRQHRGALVLTHRPTETETVESKPIRMRDGE